MFRLILATLIAYFIGKERKRQGKEGGGSRTLSIVALASCLIAILTLEIMNKINPTTFNFSRMMAYCLVGIGFLTSAVIHKSKQGIEGLTTASTIWAIVPISFTIGLGFYWYGLISTIILYIILESKYWIFKGE